MKNQTRKTFKLRQTTVAVMTAMTALTAAPLAFAGAGFGPNTLADGSGVMRPTFFAHSPSGLYPDVACFDATGASAAPATLGGTCDSGTALRKFVDALPNVGLPGGAGAYISVAAPDQTTYPGSDYYELVVMESVIQMHSDLPAPGTHLRTYVQVDPVATDSAGLTKSSVTDARTGLTFNSLGIPLVNSDGSPVMISRPDGLGGFVQKQAYGWDKPTYLGSTIVAFQGTPTRLKFYNGLPAGHGVTDPVTGAFTRNGDLLIPVDRSNPGAGDGPAPLGTFTQVLDSASVAGPYDPANPFQYHIVDQIDPATGLPVIDPATGLPVPNPNYVARPDYLQYTQNRAELHLHGGDNPWVSDGHPHQWVAPPADELNMAVPAEFRRGPIAYNVPDMADPGPGAVTYYWPNAQTGRLMMFHDHATGITRLNAYMGEAAGYVLVDPVELGMIAKTLTATNGTPSVLDLVGIPLVIQDKTFVPKNIAQQDARWDTTHWGSYGDLWYPHVYEPNQDPDSIDGTNPVGRWDWGAFFWPVFPSVYAMPTGVWGDETLTPEAWMDTPTVNGMAYPTLTVDPKTYRFRMLAVANDRGFNLGLYVAGDKTTPIDGVTGLPLPVDPVTGMVDTSVATNGVVGYSKICNGVGDTIANCTEVSMVPFDNTRALTPTKTQFPIAGGPMGTGWGTIDNRFGGVPDPDTMGPALVQIGTEAGLLAEPNVIPSTPINYEYNKRSVTIMNVLERGLWLTPAERADVLVDFSAYAGKTLILYNDSPAPIPAGDPRLDFFVGMGDFTAFGGAPNPLPGYGPNTRTVMQIHVKSVAEGGVPAVAPLDTTVLAADLHAAYAATQPMPIVPQSQYAAAFGTAWTDTLARIYTGAIYLNKYVPLTFTTPTEINYTKAPVCSSLTTCNTALAAVRAKQDPALPPTMKGLTKAAAGTVVNAYVENKAIQELFEPDYGRMNATLGVELPFTSALIQTTIPLAYVDPATEIIKDGETQFWKITHNGVDSHPVHFHMLNVQVLNRIGWDGTVKPVLQDEWGWKETVRMNPLEDIVVAVRAKTNPAPFGLPYSYRLDAPHLVLGDNHGFTQVNPTTGNPAVLANKFENYKYEYVWHCHILGHEENDFMRPFILDPGVTNPAAGVIGSNAPTNVAAAMSGANVQVTWTDASPVVAPGAGQTFNQVNAAILDSNLNGSAMVNKQEIGFRVERGTGANPATFTALGTAKQPNAITNPINTLANATSFTDTTLPAPATAGAATGLTVTAVTNGAVTLGWTAGAGATGYDVYRAVVTGGVIGAYATVATGVVGTTYTDTTVSGNTEYSYYLVSAPSSSQYTYRVVAVNAAGDAVSANTATVGQPGVPATSATVNAITPAAIILNAATGLAAQMSASNGVVLSFTNQSTGETGYNVQIQRRARATATCVGLAPTRTCNITLQANMGGFGYTAAPAVTLTGGNGTTCAVAPVATINATGSVTGISAASGCTGTTNPTVTIANPTGFSAYTGAVTVSAPAAAGMPMTATLSPITMPNNSVTSFRVAPTANAGALVGPVSTASAAINLGNGPAAPTTVAAAAGALPGQVNLTWVDVANNNATYTIQARTYNPITGATGGWVNATTVPAPVAGNLAAATVTGLATGTRYQFQIRGTNANGNSAWVQAPTGTASVLAP